MLRELLHTFVGALAGGTVAQLLLIVFTSTEFNIYTFLGAVVFATMAVFTINSLPGKRKP